MNTKPKIKKTPTRSGPRPIFLHSNTAMLTWQSLRLLWPGLQTGEIPFHPQLHKTAKNLIAKTEKLTGEEKQKLRLAIDEHAKNNLDHFQAGIQTYHANPFKRPKPKAKTIWRRGDMRVLDYGSENKNAPPVFIIPSLVNKYYILDLLPEKTFAGYLRAQGFRPIILDWGAPGPREKDLDFSGYTQILLQAFDHVCAKVKPHKPVISGYCMGGVFAVANALHRPRDYTGLMLIATPWDFAKTYPQTEKIDFYINRVLPHFEKTGLIPIDLIQSMFFDIDPLLVVRKFTKIGKHNPGAAPMRQFAALEDWINDGVELSHGVLTQCLRDWYRDNKIGQGKFKVLGKDMNPKSIRKPVLLVIPRKDRIVPPENARQLAKNLARKKIINAETGHIGLMASSYAEKEIWPQIVKWLNHT